MTEAKAASDQSSSSGNLAAVPPFASEERFRLVLETSLDGFAILRHVQDAAGTIADFMIEYVNPVVANRVKRTADELLGQSLLQLFPDCKSSGIFDRYAAVVETGIPTTFETSYESHGVTGWFHNVVVRLNEEIVVSFSDISERKRTEAERRRGEQRRDTQYAIAQILAEAETIAEATPAILQALCENLGWQVGVIWGMNSDQSALCAIHCWQSPTANMQSFVDISQQAVFAQGIGIPGRVWAIRQPIWIAALHQDSNIPRSTLATQAGLQSAVGFPISLHDEILGVIECFSDRIQEPDADLLQMMAAIGSQIGQFMERKRTEAALRESQELFQSFMNHSPIAAFMKDAGGRYLYANPWIERVYQRSQAEIIGKTDFELLQPAIAQQVHANDVAVLTSGQPMQMLETIHHEDGEHSYMSFKFPFRNAAGQQVLAGVAIDISERAQAEATLRQREAELRLITNAVPVMISFVDAQQRYRFNNQRYEEWWGKPAAEINGKYLWEVLGKETYAAIRPYVEQVLAGQAVTYESKIPHRTGKSRHVMVNYVPRFDQQGKVEGFVALVHDITERKQAEESLQQSEERLRIAQQAANAGVWDWDITTNQVTWSAEYYRLYGLDPAITPSSYQNWLDSIFEQDRDRADRISREALTHQIDLNVEFRILHPTKGERWLTAIGQTFYDEHQQPQRMTGIALDVTDRKRSQAALQESEAKFQAIVRNLPGVIYRYASLPDGSDAFTYVSSGSVELLELEPETIVQDSRVIWSLFHPDDLPSLRSSVAAVVKDLLPWQWEGRLITPSGQVKWIQGRSRPEKTEQGTVWNGLLIDITERRQAEAALRTSEERFQLIAKATNDVMWDCDLVTNKMWWSERVQTVFGYHPEEIGTDMSGWAERVHPDDVARIHTSYINYLSSSAAVWTDEYRFRRADGSYADILDRAYVIRDAVGNPLRLVGAMSDISDRKRVQRELQQTLQTLRESEEWARLAIQVGRLGGWRLHLDSNLVEMDERMREIWGEPDDAVMVPLPKVVERMHPADRARVTNAVSAAIDPQSSGIYEIEYRILWNDGTMRWVLANGQAQFEGEGASRQTVDFFGTLLDITDRKQAEESLRNSAERLSVALSAAKLGDWSWNAETDIVTFSEQAAAMFGIPPGPYMTWTRMQALLHPDDRQQTRLQVEQAIAGHSDYDIEYRVIQPDQTNRWVAAKGRAQYSSSGQVLGMLGVVQDITPRKAAEAEREQLLVNEQIAREEAERANRIKDEFLAVLSHELRSPLNPILGWARLLQTRKFDDTATKRALETIERNAKLQTQLIDDLLDVSRILRGKMVLNVCPVHLETVIDAALETVRLSAEAKSIDIQKSVAGNIGSIAGDSGRLQQVMWNLLANAVKFTPNGGHVEIHLEQVGLYAQIQVRDTGKGIAPEFLPYVFDYFRQEDGTTTRKFGGLGLGLAIVRYLTELHGGTVQAASPGEGLGATFTVLLPISKSNSQPDEANAIKAEADAFPLADLRILVVDDEADMRDLIATVLEQTGAAIKVTASPAEALAALDIFKPDVLISDIGMPQTDGYELIRQIRNLPSHPSGQIPAIALTAYAGQIDRQQTLASGFQKHLAKPIEPEALVQAIVALVRSWRAADRDQGIGDREQNYSRDI